jgi:hypothetical protein
VTIQDVCDRCSKYSGGNLAVEIEDEVLTFVNADDFNVPVVSVAKCGSPFTERFWLREVYGRMHHLGITVEEQHIIIDVL